MVFKKEPEKYKADVVKIVDDIFNEAISAGASDIHLEPKQDSFIIRYRIDSVLRVVFEGKKKLFEHVIARIKILAQLETTGLPRPQEGTIKFNYKKDFIDLRVSIFPTSLGESIVIRILESKEYMSDFPHLGFTERQSEELRNIIRKPYGLILVTGPNGVGKSTTLFNLLYKLNEPERSLATLEDPIECKINMVRQTEINHKIGLTFAEGLRYLLRQDPDVIMVGEIRDKETARIAVEAAVTGHLVLATIHTNNAAGAIVRLINMGVDPFLLSTALKFVSSQRLARKNCPHCKTVYEPPEELINILDAPRDIKFYHSIGCDKCNNLGQMGRKGIHEVLVVTRAIQELILKKPSDIQINKLAIEEGMMTLRRSALQKVYDGVISIEEAIRLIE